jgi:hypothetical protein
MLRSDHPDSDAPNAILLRRFYSYQLDDTLQQRHVGFSQSLHIQSTRYFNKPPDCVFAIIT